MNGPHPKGAAWLTTRQVLPSIPVPDRTKPLYLYAHTAARMQSAQLFGMAKRKVREVVVPHIPVDFDARYERNIPNHLSVRTDAITIDTFTLRECLDGAARDEYRERARAAALGAPTFLNRSLQIWDNSGIEWYADRFDDVPLLWRLKLYGFDPLLDLVLGVDPADGEAKMFRDRYDQWILDWIDSIEIRSPRYLRRAWTPWSVSLRLENWIRYFSWRQGVVVDHDLEWFEQVFAREIYKNTLFLENNLEWDVGGNHLIKNGAALLTAGLFFAGQSKWIDIGTGVLAETAQNQFLPDGCHFERSPMYHTLTLRRLLSSIHLLERSGRSIPSRIETTASNATDFLRFLQPPDGKLPLLNDSVYDEALSLDACLRYARAVGIDPPRSNGTKYGDQTGVVTKPPSGYCWLRTTAGSMFFDGGPVGPPHLPGHSHSDTLSILLWLDGQPILTDTGTFDYESGPRRNFARGVRAHNTVQVGSVEPIEVGGQYLMGARVDPELRVDANGISIVEGRYMSKSMYGPPYVHHRAVYASDDWWLVRDSVTDHGELPVVSRLHLHPEVEPSETAPHRLHASGEVTGYVYPVGTHRSMVSDGWFFPRFGECIQRPVIDLYSPRKDPAIIEFLVTPRSLEPSSIALHVDNGAPTTLTIQAKTYYLPNLALSRGA